MQAPLKVTTPEGTCELKDTLDKDQNVIARSPTDRWTGGTAAGEHCGIRIENDKEVSLPL
jgi:hypothetical protein